MEPPHETGAWSEEITGPFYVFKDAGCEVTLASVQGGKIPIDQGSLSDSFKTENDTRFMADADAMALLENSTALSSLDLGSFDIIFLPGGHGTCVDFPVALGSVVTEAYAAGKVVAAVCHGPCGLVNATASGEPLVQGKKVCAFTNAEEDQVGLSDKVPFLLESKLREQGCDFVLGDPWTETAVADGNLVTGQNPQSSVKCAQLALEAHATATPVAESSGMGCTVM